MGSDEKLHTVFVAGGGGMVGSAICAKLSAKRSVEVEAPSSEQLDLTSQDATLEYFSRRTFDEAYLCAARVGGILANSLYQYDFLRENLLMALNFVDGCMASGTGKALLLGSSCIYPRGSTVPIAENLLLSGNLEPTNEGYAIAKIAGLKLGQYLSEALSVHRRSLDCRAAMPCNLYGLNDTYHPDNSHVIPALIRRFHEAKMLDQKQVVVWGSGRPKREFLFADDLSEACLSIMELSKHEWSMLSGDQAFVNIGSGTEISIKELAHRVKSVVGFKGNVKFDSTKPDGVLSKLLDSSKIRSLGWRPTVEIEIGLRSAYRNFLEKYESVDRSNEQAK